MKVPATPAPVLPARAGVAPGAISETVVALVNAGLQAEAARRTLPQAAGPAQAVVAPTLLTRLTGILPLAAGVTQALVGFAITKGTMSIAAMPVLGAVPPWLVGMLVAATSMPTIMQGIGRVLGKL